MAISPSQLSLFDRCSRKWALSRTSPEPTSPEAQFGIDVHDLIPKAILGRSYATGTFSYMPDPELARILSGVLVREAVRVFHSFGFLKYETERMIETKQVRGRIDLWGETHDGKLIVLDWKTTTRRFTDHDARTSDQLTCYCHLIHHKLGRYPDYVCLVPLSLTEGRGYALRTTRTSEDLTTWLDKLTKVMSAMAQGFTYRNPSACMDYGKSCVYYETCWKEQEIEVLYDDIPSLT